MPKIEKDLLKVKGSDGQWHYVPAVGGEGGSTPTWETVQDKPFESLGDGLSVENGVLSAQGGGGSPNAVQYVAQELTDEQKTQARENIGAGTSSFSGSYNDLTSKPTIPTQVTIDSTLKQSGQAADAKAVGDALQHFTPTEALINEFREIELTFATKLDKNQGAENAGKILGVGEDGNVIPQDKPTYTLPQATADALGGIKADAATEEDTQDVRIGADGKLKTKPTGDSSVTVDDALSLTSENPVQNKVITAALAGKITSPTTAAVGQIIKVKSVDDAGKPTEWEVADLDEKVELIASGTIEEVASLAVTKDSDGNALSLKNCYVVINGALDGAGSTSICFRVADNTSGTVWDRYEVECKLKKDNPAIRATFVAEQGKIPLLYTEYDLSTTAFATNDTTVQFAIYRNNVTGRAFEPLHHTINQIIVGNNQGNGKLGAGTKYEIYGVRV